MTSIDAIPMLCKQYLDSKTFYSLSLTCKQFRSYVPYYPTPFNDAPYCVRCEQKVSDPNTPCVYHLGLRTPWTSSFVMDREHTYYRYSYVSHTCCTKEKGCEKHPAHNLEGAKCGRCGEIFDPQASQQTNCIHHAAKGGLEQDKWPCCNIYAKAAKGCLGNDGTEYKHEPGLQWPVDNVVWSRLGTKVAVQTRNEVNIFSYNKETQVWAQKYCLVGARLVVRSTVGTTHPDGNSDFAFSPNGRYLLLKVAHTNIVIFDLQEGI